LQDRYIPTLFAVLNSKPHTHVGPGVSTTTRCAHDIGIFDSSLSGEESDDSFYSYSARTDTQGEDSSQDTPFEKYSAAHFRRTSTCVSSEYPKREGSSLVQQSARDFQKFHSSKILLLTHDLEDGSRAVADPNCSSRRSAGRTESWRDSREDHSRYSVSAWPTFRDASVQTSPTTAASAIFTCEVCRTVQLSRDQGEEGQHLKIKVVDASSPEYQP
jgi:hypothetical protein